GDTDLISRVSSENYNLLAKERRNQSYELFDLGPSLEYNFLMFNLNDLKPGLVQIADKQKWFSDLRFRQAVSAAIDREGIVKLVYGTRGVPLWGNVSPSNRLWVDQTLPHPARSAQRGGAWAAEMSIPNGE